MKKHVNFHFEKKIGDGSQEDQIDVVIPCYDFVPSEYISLIIGQEGEYTTDYIYRLYKESYDKEEYLLDFSRINICSS